MTTCTTTATTTSVQVNPSVPLTTGNGTDNHDELVAQGIPAHLVPSAATQTKSSLVAFTDIPQEIIGQIFKFCLGDISTHALVYVDWHFYRNIMEIVKGIKLEQLCPQLKTISAEQAKECGFQAEPLPISLFRKLKVINDYYAMAPHVEGDMGVTHFDFTLPALTLRQIVTIAQKQGIEVRLPWDRVLKEIGDVAAEQMFPCMLANNVFKDSRNKSFKEHCVLVNGLGCELPTVQLHSMHIVIIQKIDNECLFGNNPLTYGHTSTCVNGVPLVVGGSAPARFVVNARGFNFESCGAGGRRKF